MKDKLLASFLFPAVLVALTSTAIATTTWYVNGVSGGNSNTCTSPTTACKTVGHAISLAASGDSIRVAAATYQEHLTIGINLKILGSGARTTILDGGSVGRVVAISSATAHVTLSGVTITNGNFLSGAGITNYGVLMLLRSAVTGNRVQLSCSQCATSGGGILNAVGAILTIGNSTISGNHVSLSGCSHSCSARGGGISNRGTLVLYNSTISGNTASPYGQGNGSGISSDGTAIIRNSTLGGNGGSGAATIYGTAAVQNSIVANNGSSNCGVQDSSSLARGNRQIPEAFGDRYQARA